MDPNRQACPHQAAGEGRRRGRGDHLRPVAENPRRVGKAFRRELEGLHSARRGDFRIIYRKSGVVTIMALHHRVDIYRSH